MIISKAAKEAITVKLEKLKSDVESLASRAALSDQERAELEHKRMHLEALEWVLSANKL